MDIFLSFDFDADSAERLYYSDKPVKISKAEFSIRRGIYRVLALLRTFGIKTTFFVPGWIAEQYPTVVHEVVVDGHELAMHGYRHEKLENLSYDEEYKIHTKAKRILGQFQREIYGFRKPYFEMSKNTLEIIANLGIMYDSSLMSDDEPYIIRINEKIMVELPIYDIFDDWILFEIEHRTPQEVLQLWIYELESAEELGINYFSLILHPACIGRASRIRILKEFIKHALKRGHSFKMGKQIAQERLLLSK